MSGNRRLRFCSTPSHVCRRRIGPAPCGRRERGSGQSARPVERIAGEAAGERNAPAHRLSVEHQFQRVSRLTTLERHLQLGHIDARSSELLQIEKKLPNHFAFREGSNDEIEFFRCRAARFWRHESSRRHTAADCRSVCCFYGCRGFSRCSRNGWAALLNRALVGSERLKLQALNVGIWIWRIAKIGIEAKLLEHKNIVVGKLFGLQICKDHWISQTSVDMDVPLGSAAQPRNRVEESRRIELHIELHAPKLFNGSGC